MIEVTNNIIDKIVGYLSLLTWTHTTILAASCTAILILLFVIDGIMDGFDKSFIFGMGAFACAILTLLAAIYSYSERAKDAIEGSHTSYDCKEEHEGVPYYSSEVADLYSFLKGDANG